MAHSFGDPCLRDATKWGSGNHAMQWSNLNFAGLPLGLAYHRWMWEFLLWFLSINEKVVSPKKCAGLLLGLISWYRFWKNKADSSRDLQTIYYVVVQHGECNAKLSDTRLFGPFLPSFPCHAPSVACNTEWARNSFAPGLALEVCPAETYCKSGARSDHVVKWYILKQFCNKLSRNAMKLNFPTIYWTNQFFVFLFRSLQWALQGPRISSVSAAACQKRPPALARKRCGTAVSDDANEPDDLLVCLPEIHRLSPH